MRNTELSAQFDRLLAMATKKVRPPDYAIKFYNFMGRIPFKIGALIFLVTGIDSMTVTKKARKGDTDAAIQVIYNYRVKPWKFVWAIGDHLWQMSYNCRSVRSRGMFAREMIRVLMGDLRGPSSVVSLGSGSASQMLQGVADNQIVGERTQLILVDNDFNALERGRKNARNLGIEDLIDFQETTVGKFLKEAESESINIIEMVGLTDYFNDNRFQSYLEDIYRVLVKGGFFLGANISSREEEVYAHNVAGWPKMYYRQQKEIVANLKAAGFQKISVGQCGLYTVWLVQRIA